MKGGKDYRAWIRTPIASQDFETIEWIGQMSDFPAMAAFGVEHGDSDAAKRRGPMFEAVIDCELHSFWEVHEVK